MIRFKINWYGILLTLFFVPGTLVCQMTDGVVLAPNNSPSFSPTGPDAETFHLWLTIVKQLGGD